ncbi:hypothetical protein [Aquimarina macrocephali]|uniref:hypothetical protein n=1 Tax=Aquimarina macrocephali TaxID=666563 RepID=UPI000467431C|nr:hypothetical protein [Aquimarina macrocephali]
MEEKVKLELVKINTIASDLRNKISNGSIKFPYSEAFPLGCCGAASRLLESKLKKEGFENVRYVNHWRGGKSHAWVEYKDYIIDITADQFEGEENERIIIKEKDKSDFHKQFKPDIF